VSAADFPRILVITSNNFNLISGGGITLTNLFRGWPSDRIANLHEDPTPEDHSVCRISYRLSDAEIGWAWPLSLVRGWSAPAGSCGGHSGENSTGAPSVASEGEEGVGRRYTRWIVGDGIPRSVKITDRLARWLDAFRPDLLYGFLGSMAQIRLVRELARTLGIPVAIHIMDDWPSVLYRRGLLGPLLRRVVQREFDAVLRDARLRLGICEDMCAEYRLRYGYPFFPFHNALDVDEWLPHAKRDWRPGSPFVVRYVGSIVADGQRDALRDVCDGVASLRASGADIEMWVHAPRAHAAYLHDGRFPREGLHLVDPPGAGIVSRLLAEADLLVLPFNFDTRSARYLRFSMPTKVPAYMVSGTPILVYGPPEIAIARYARRDGWGHLVTTVGIQALRKALQWLMDDQAARELLGRRAHELARQRHDAADVRSRFQAVLAETVAKARQEAGRSDQTTT